jgi:hypothetical protein
MKSFDSTPIQQLRSKTLANLHQLLPPGGGPSHLPTETFAKFLQVKPGTIRRSLCKLGHYQGVIPLKMANGRLLWPVI